MFSKSYWKENGLLTPAEAAVIYGVKRDTLRKWYQRGHLAGIKASNGRVYFYCNDLEATLASRLKEDL